MSARESDLNCFDVTGRVVAITGGAGLLGSEFGRVLAGKGARVALGDVKEGDVRTRAKEIGTMAAGQCLGLAVDITDAKSVGEFVSRTVEAFGRVDVLINSAVTETAAGHFYAPFEEYTLEDWEAIMAVNVRGAFLCCQAAGRQMVSQGSGSIINMSSIYGMVGPDTRIYAGTPLSLPAAYSASKGAILSLTRHLATYWAKQGVRVNCITPGGVRTENVDRTFVDHYSARTPMGRMADKSDLRGAILFLASDASAYVTGHNLVVDGGWTAW
jgi:NAD(P)-dependent dehydrogenase (short-subunit alcohol dehydrogenase family)